MENITITKNIQKECVSHVQKEDMHHYRSKKCAYHAHLREVLHHVEEMQEKGVVIARLVNVIVTTLVMGGVALHVQNVVGRVGPMKMDNAIHVYLGMRDVKMIVAKNVKVVNIVAKIAAVKCILRLSY